MAENYRMLTESIQERINPDHLSLQKAFSTDFEIELSTLNYSDVVKYIRLAMKGVGAEYTNRSFQAGENAKTHLRNELTNVNFEYQGSVMTNTHIRAHSDIDLLTISNDFFSYDHAGMSLVANNTNYQSSYFPRQVQLLKETVEGPRYSGSATETLRQLRLDSEGILGRKYVTCDKTHAKAIKIRNQGIGRDVDVVIANYYDDITSVINSKGRYRGIQVYNKDTNAKGSADYPFLSIDRINERGIQTVDRIKRMIRFLKNMKAKSGHDITLSSFDFNAICYDIPAANYRTSTFLQLVPVLHDQIQSICFNSSHSNRLTSVDGREHIFRDNPTKLAQLRLVFAELSSVYTDLLASGARL
ncbi:hypothetical protein Q5H93_06335 [Hymenobacter sp. ASUV-10]|uniref:cGAS/DncV-like nucleotidyltransferase C-terminal helical domain-containing protein n=1 Tax=Hymenobacter aranciens TaxID=3063996 RepID=A0ABT9B9K4_9BACT|nr:hypothetical protein [Hymenobacter sp. ASUV-10]MDO7874343.1 hypothetical protein [Hymenobacter sp. ASUV-10]